MTTADETVAMKDDSYPGLHRSADTASLRAQKIYLRLQKAYLGSLVLGSLASAFASLKISGLNVWLYTAIAIILILGLLILWVTRARQDDKIWFDGRAVAESVKTATWRFMMKAPPFQENEDVEGRFISELKEIREARPHLGKHLASAMDSNSSAITDFMKKARTDSIAGQKKFYIDGRIGDQKSWYSRKAKINADNGGQWFWATVSLQGIAVATAIVQAVKQGLGVNAVSVITTCAASIAAWNQMKRHDELSQSYTLAAQELEELEAIANNLKSDTDFPQLVEQVEEAISREHTMWCARRDVLLSGRSRGNTR